MIHNQNNPEKKQLDVELTLPLKNSNSSYMPLATILEYASKKVFLSLKNRKKPELLYFRQKTKKKFPIKKMLKFLTFISLICRYCAEEFLLSVWNRQIEQLILFYKNKEFKCIMCKLRVGLVKSCRRCKSSVRPHCEYRKKTTKKTFVNVVRKKEA
jgi:hypothetical protein